MLTAMKFYTQRPEVQTQSKSFPIDKSFEVKGSNFVKSQTENTYDWRQSDTIEPQNLDIKQNFDIKLPKVDVFDFNILTEKTAERRTVDGRNSEMLSTALKEQGSAKKDTVPGFETLKLAHENTLTGFG